MIHHRIAIEGELVMTPVGYLLAEIIREAVAA
jgi:hypothetical protein